MVDILTALSMGLLAYTTFASCDLGMLVEDPLCLTIAAIVAYMLLVNMSSASVAQTIDMQSPLSQSTLLLVSAAALKHALQLYQSELSTPMLDVASPILAFIALKAILSPVSGTSGYNTTNRARSMDVDSM